MTRIRLQPMNRELFCSGAARLVDVAEESGAFVLPLSCRGARCGICRVRVVRGAELLAGPSEAERGTLRELGADGSDRLACQIWVREGVDGEVELALTRSGAAES